MDAGYLRSTTNTPTPGHRGPLKAKVSVSTLAQVRGSKPNDRPAHAIHPRPRSPLKVHQEATTRTLRSPSPIRPNNRSSPVGRVNSPDLSTVGRVTSRLVPKAKASALSLAQRASPAQVTSSLRVGPDASIALATPLPAYSLPPSPEHQLLPPLSPEEVSAALLHPRLGGHHLRTSSISDASSLSLHSPSSSSLGTYDGNSEVASSSRVESVVGITSNGVDNRSPTSPVAGPSIRVKSKVSALVISSTNSTKPSLSPTLSFPSLNHQSVTRKASLSSASGRSPAQTHRSRAPSTSSALSTSPPQAPRPISATTSRVTAKPFVNNMHFSSYQPFPIPSLPAPPAPDAISDVLHHSPPPKSPPLAQTHLSAPKSPPLASLFAQVRPRSGTSGSSTSDKPGSTMDTPRDVATFAPLPSEESLSRGEDYPSEQAEARSNRKVRTIINANI